MDYSKLSDAEINWKVAFHIGLRTVEKSESGDFNPCNNPADAWPIISANRISVEYDSEDKCDVPAEWVTAYAIDDLKVHVVAHQPCDKALRSAMIVFLMMQDSANVQDNPSR